jgi:CubicO group peptidase (beta-lactamase class C family)
MAASWSGRVAPGSPMPTAAGRYEGLASRNLKRVSEIFAAVPPNTQTKYSNLGYQMLGEVVQRASGIGYPQYIRDRILTPLSMSSTDFEPLDPELAARRATGYAARAFSDEPSVAPAMPLLWAEGGLWSTVEDLGRWLSFQLAAHVDALADTTDANASSDVLASATRREMHKPRYLSDEDWSSAFGISWYSVRKDEVTWVQHSGGLPGFTSNARITLPEISLGLWRNFGDENPLDTQRAILRRPFDLRVTLTSGSLASKPVGGTLSCTR